MIRRAIGLEPGMPMVLLPPDNTSTLCALDLLELSTPRNGLPNGLRK
ncbi:MAG: hypothetical protein ABIW76_22580 [Fibrobacteria bacterium]